MLEKGVILLLMVGVPVAALAEARPPRYDINGVCHRLATSSEGVSVESEQLCLRTQNDAFDAVRRLWLGTPDEIQQECDQRARHDGDKDYVLLRQCLREKLGGARFERGG